MNFSKNSQKESQYYQQKKIEIQEKSVESTGRFDMEFY
jgi:hypothetical protein